MGGRASKFIMFIFSDNELFHLGLHMDSVFISYRINDLGYAEHKS